MMSRRRKGFTLIELLVVIAIIGILAAMVFPVFARARESARKAVCLSNVKNLSLAFQMYFLDNDDIFLVLEHRPEVRDWFANTYRVISKGAPYDGSINGCKAGKFYGNPYLRAPVVLDDYTRSRALWQCPNAKLLMGAQVINGCIPDWFTWAKNEAAADPDVEIGVCPNSYPPGWGGEVTDSLLQWRLANFTGNEGGAWGVGDPAKNAFMSTIAVMDKIEAPKSYGPITDPAKYAIIGDGGNIIDELDIGCVAYADICGIECQNWGARYAGCIPSSVYYGDEDGTPEGDPGLLKDVSARRQYARHLGGANLGFRDGHAAWFDSERMIDMWMNGELTGINDEMDWPVSHAVDPDCEFTDNYEGVPTIR